MRIGTREELIAMRERSAAEQGRRVEQQLDASDCALSWWADNAIMYAVNTALAALDKGASYGVDFPVARKWVLCYGDDIVSEREISSKFYGGKRSWVLSAAWAGRFGRRFIPSKPSRVQKSLGLKERAIIVEASRELEAACAGIGCPVHYFAVPMENGGRVLGFEDVLDKEVK